MIDGTGHLYVNPAVSSLTNYLNVNTGGTVAAILNVINPSVPGSGITLDGQYISFNSGVAGGIVFSDSTEQSTAYNPFAVYFLSEVVHNTNIIISTVSSTSTAYIAGNLQVIDCVSYTGSTMPIVFPTPDADGYYFELVISNGPGSYSVSGVGVDGVTAATIFFEFGSTSYEKGAFRYVESTNTWYQVV